MELPRWIRTLSPLATTITQYRREQFVGDLIAGIIVAIMLIPQAMAYAMLAGLPPQVGLYASIVPLILYSLFGSSNSLAVGPVAMVSLLVLSGVRGLATPGSAEYIGLCLTLALLVGVLQIGMAALRLGFLVNFISHPVLVGFTSAAALVIGLSQVKHVIGVPVESSEYPLQLIANIFSVIGNANITTLWIGLASCVVLAAFAFGLTPLLKSLGVKERSASMVAKVGPLVTVVIASCVVFGSALNQSLSVGVVGEIPPGLPGITIPKLSWTEVRSLLPLALTITLVGYLESISVAKALAARRREKVDANRELLALGVADVGAAFTGGYPVTGGFSRSMVNHAAGGSTQLGSVFTAVFVAISVLLLTPLFYYIPNAALAAIIIVAVAPLVDFKTPVKLWKYSRSDCLALVVTFIAVLSTGIESGILVGVVTTVVLLMWKMSRPHVAEVGRLGTTEHFRNVKRYDVQTTPGLFAFRVDESLNFANAPFLHTYIMEQIADHPSIYNVLLISSGINDVDATGMEVLETIRRDLELIGVGFYMSDVKGPVTDRMKRAGCDPGFLKEHIFLSADEAVRSLTPAEQAR